MRLPDSSIRVTLRATRPLFRSRLVPLAAKRRCVDAVTSLVRAPRGTKFERAEMGAVPGLLVTPPRVRPDGMLLYLHGGGYALGSARAYAGFAGQLAGRIGIRAFVPDYRLAPEHPYPAALEDVLAAYQGLLEDGYAPQRIIVAGDSAGGGLSLALAIALRERQLPAPAAVGLICPWLDLAADFNGTRPPVRNPLLTADMAREWACAYAGGHDCDDPAISPLRGDLRGLPPIVVDCAGDDPLACDGQVLAERGRAAGTRIEHTRYDGMWHVFHIHTGILAASDQAIDAFAARLKSKLGPGELARLRVAVVGAGMSGLAMAHRLREAGIEEFTVYEKADRVGGTWRDNHYPGLTCDAPARCYTYSWAPNPDLTQLFATGAEIWRYFDRLSDEDGLRPFIRFGSEVTSASLEDGRWRITTSDGHEDVVDILVTATGVLHHPTVPEVPGLDSFAGPCFHSARWDDSISLDARRVAVVGNGSSGVQIVTALAGHARQVLAFQRTPQWIAPFPNRRYRRLTRALFRRSPSLDRLAYRSWQELLEHTAGRAVIDRQSWQYRLFDVLCRLNLRLSVRDDELRRKLTPDYPPMCKRLVVSGGFYRAMQRPDVTLITDPIERVVPEGIVTDDGRLHEVDVIVLATGFDAHAYVRPIQITGETGVTLDEAWAAGPFAYRTVMVPGFPNLFMLMGPSSPIGNQSLISVAETQTGFAMRWIDELRRGHVRAVAPAPEATTAYNEARRAALPDTVWVTGCNSWYLGPDGLPDSWPWTPERLREMLEKPDPHDFVLSYDGSAVVPPAPPYEAVS